MSPIELEGKVFEVPASAFEDVRVSKFLEHLTTEEKMSPAEAKSFVEEILSEGFRELGDTYLTEMKAHVERIQELRTELRTKYDAVLDLLKNSEGKPVELPPELKPEKFNELFDKLSDEVDSMQPPEEALKAVDEAKATEALKQGVAELPPEHPAAGLTDEQWQAEVDKLFDEWGDTTKQQLPDAPENLDVPRVKGGRIGEEDIRVRKEAWGERADIEDIALKPGETPRQAVARVRKFIGKNINETPLAESWAKARAKVLEDAGVKTPEELGRTGALEGYKKAQRLFWENVRSDPVAMEYLDALGFELAGDSGAAKLRMSDPNLPVEQSRVSLDHSAEKAFGENWKLALNGENLVFEFHSPNSFRDSAQRALRIETYAQ